jgi:imidazoleglycerol-phosphate dehydratase/histidinol-phosphatase
MMDPRLVLFIDRDGTLIEEPQDFQVDALDKVRLVPGVMPALLRLKDAGFRFVMVSNQDGLGTDRFPADDFHGPHEFVRALFASQGIEFEHEFICPHFEEDRCDCRKPRTGLLTRYLAATTIDLERSAVIGDRETDVALARNIGVAGLQLGPDGDWDAIARTLLGRARRARVERTTRETKVTVTLDLDGDGPVSACTGIGFYDHMLEQVGKHAGIALEVRCEGDLEVDQHHTVEDVALTLGQALREALGAKRGIGRYGFVLPMDESEARVSLDLGGRPYAVFEGALPAARVGELDAEMVPHFYRSLADSLRAAIHVHVDGQNTHHMVESSFKGLGRCLRQAVANTGGGIPSTKGAL